ncbi:MAG TPA: hypothetical protein VIO36_05810 [Anaerolineaceae bacterium]
MHPRFKYFVVSLTLSGIVFLITIVLFPEWRQSLRLLLTLGVMVISGVVSFIASARQAFAADTSREEFSPSKSETRTINISGGNYIEGDVNVNGDFVSGDKYVINPRK